MKKLWTHLGSNRLLFLSTLTVGLLYCLNSVILPNASGVLVNQVAAAAPLSLGLFLPFLSVSLLQIALSILDDYMSKHPLSPLSTTTSPVWLSSTLPA